MKLAGGAVLERAAEAAESRTSLPSVGAADAAGRSTSELKHLVDGLLRLQESERTRTSLLIADEIIPVITMARYLIEEAAQRVAHGEAEDTSESLHNAAARIRDAACQLVAVSQELRPRAIDDLGLLAALAWYFREFSHDNRGIFVSPRITVSEPEVPSHLKLPIFRIVQAALSNVARHSKASAARVLMTLVEDELRLSVEDNGVGFDVERWRHRRHAHDGCGLGVISRWAEASGGRCSVEAVPRHGARVQVAWRLDLVRGSAAEAGADASPPAP